MASYCFIGTAHAFAASQEAPALFHNHQNQHRLTSTHPDLHLTPCLGECLNSIIQGQEEDHKVQSSGQLRTQDTAFISGISFAFTSGKLPFGPTSYIALYLLDCAFLI